MKKLKTTEEKINRMDTALATVIVLFLQCLADRFGKDMQSEQGNTIYGFIDNLLEAYCDIVDDPSHDDVLEARLNDVMNKWLEIRGTEDDERAAD